MTESFWLPHPEGVDPYDALRSPRIPDWARSSKRMRQVAIQLRKRLPLDTSRLLGIEPYAMAKTIGCLLLALARATSAPDRDAERRAQALVDRLEEGTRSAPDAGWGYEFDVQTRWAYYAAYSPNVIATTFVGRGLLAAGVVFDRPDWVDAGVAAAEFVRQGLMRDAPGGSAAFYYTPDTDVFVHNANLLGCALCAAAGAFAPDRGYAHDALGAARVSAAAQGSDGSWPYGDAPGLEWVDSFHTAYDLDGLLHVWLATGDSEIQASLCRGAHYWLSNFFGPQGEPYYYDGAGPPFDIHSAATAVDVGYRLAAWGFAERSLIERVERWTKAHLVDPASGRTFYRRGRLVLDRRSFARWGDAHWAMARASAVMIGEGRTDPLERAIQL